MYIRVYFFSFILVSLNLFAENNSSLKDESNQVTIQAQFYYFDGNLDELGTKVVDDGSGAVFHIDVLNEIKGNLVLDKLARHRKAKTFFESSLTLNEGEQESFSKLDDISYTATYTGKNGKLKPIIKKVVSGETLKMRTTVTDDHKSVNLDFTA